MILVFILIGVGKNYYYRRCVTDQVSYKKKIKNNNNKYRQHSICRLKVAYNDALRIVFRIPRFISASQMYLLVKLL